MKLSDGEKLTLIMLSEIHQLLKIKGGVNSTTVHRAICTGNTWSLDWEFQGVFGGSDIDESIATEVMQIFEMWSVIETSYQKLPSEDKVRIEIEAAPFGRDVKFKGFDGNSECDHSSVSRFVIDELRRYSIYKSRDLNAHMPLVDAHMRMLGVFASIPPQQRTALSATQIIALLKEQQYSA